MVDNHAMTVKSTPSFQPPPSWGCVFTVWIATILFWSRWVQRMMMMILDDHSCNTKTIHHVFLTNPHPFQLISSRCECFKPKRDSKFPSIDRMSRDDVVCRWASDNQREIKRMDTDDSDQYRAEIAWRYDERAPDDRQNHPVQCLTTVVNKVTNDS